MKYEDLPVLEKPDYFLKFSGGKLFLAKDNWETVENPVGQLFFTSPTTFKTLGWLHPEYKYAYANNLLCKIEGRCMLMVDVKSLVCKVIAI